MANGLTELSRRVGRLDVRAANLATPCNPKHDIESFVIAMAGTDGSAPFGPASPDEADQVVGRCALLARLEAAVPKIVVGPLDPYAQYWIGTGKPTAALTQGRRLTRRLFVPVAADRDIPVSTKPFSVGLFTSTGIAGNHGMWHTYLETAQSSLFPRPWHAWAVRPEPGARICEVATAKQWVEFVTRYISSHEGYLYPDWRSAAREYDAVHLTLRAVAAVQSMVFRSAAGVTAPAYWGVESTFWLRWCFQSSRLVSVEG